jgi:hypothetical protein
VDTDVSHETEKRLSALESRIDDLENPPANGGETPDLDEESLLEEEEEV